jgi:CheY-like chemotaxis protein
MTQILVIEDDPTQRMLTAAVLRSAGYEVLEAVDGVEGLQMARQSAPDLIVCDVMMPGLNGYKVVDALKKEPALATVPVILLTAMANRAHVRVGMVSGADDYLFKPFRATELRQSVTALLAKRALQQHAFLRASESDLNAALQQQKDTLTESYEKRLLRELDARWTGQADQNSDVCFDSATVLLVNIFSMVLAYFPPNGASSVVMRRVYEATTDSLYLFGAKHLVAAGGDLLAVFPASEQTGALSPAVMAVRSAFALQKMIGTAFGSMAHENADPNAELPTIAVALHTGAVRLIQIKDPLHGGDTLTLATGQAVKGVQALSAKALASGWEVAASRALLAHTGDSVVTGRSSLLPSLAGAPALEALELLSIALP